MTVVRRDLVLTVLDGDAHCAVWLSGLFVSPSLVRLNILALLSRACTVHELAAGDACSSVRGGLAGPFSDRMF